MASKNNKSNVKDIISIINKNDKGLGIAKIRDLLIPIGIRGNFLIKYSSEVWNYILENKDEIKLNNIDELSNEYKVIEKICKIIYDPSINDDSIWINLLKTEEDCIEFYNGKTHIIDFIKDDNEKDIIEINKSLLPKGIKKKDFNNVSYTILKPDNVFILRKRFESNIENEYTDLFIVLKIM